MAREDELFGGAGLVPGEKNKPSFSEWQGRKLGGTKKQDDPLESKPKDFTEYQERKQARSNTDVLSGANPDQFSRARKVDLPTGAAMGNIEAAEQGDLKRKAVQMAGDSPSIRKMAASDPEFAAQAHDDYEPLAELENAIQTGSREHKAVPLGPAPTLRNTLRGLRIAVEESFVGTSIGIEAQARQARRLEDPERILARAGLQQPRALEELDLSEVKERNLLPPDLAKRYAESEYRRLVATPEFESATAKAAFSGLESFITLAPLTIASVVLRTPAPILTQAAAQTQAQAYVKYRSRGANMNQALTGAVAEASIEVATELIPMSFLIKPLGRGGFTKLVGGFLAREIPGEQLATLGQDAVDTAIANPNKTWAEYAVERPDAAYATLVATAVQAGLTSGSVYAVQRATGNMSEAPDGEADANTIRNLEAAAQKAKLLSRDPEKFAEFVNTVVEQTGGLQEVYIDADTLESTLQQEGVDPTQLPDSIREQLDEASEAGSVRIPLGEALKTLATPLGKELIPHLRTTPDGLSTLEVEKELPQFEQDAQTLLQESLDKQAQELTEAQQLNEIFTEQLNTAGRFTNDVNTQYAKLLEQFYVNMAERVGVTPLQLLKQFGVSVRSGELSAKTEKQLLQEGFDPVDVEEGFDVADVEEITLEGAVAAVVEVPEDRRKELAKKLVPSLRFSDGRILRGKEGQTHPEVRARELIKQKKAGKTIEEAKVSFSGQENGFVDLDTGEFLTREKSNDKFGIFDSLQLLSPGEFELRQDKKGVRGKIDIPEDFGKEDAVISLLENADLSTFLHESAHLYLEIFGGLAAQENAPQDVKDDMQKVLDFLDIENIEIWDVLSLNEKRAEHEKFARAFESWLFEGKAPAPQLQLLFSRFRAWMMNVYRTLKNLNVELTDEVRGVFGRMLVSEQMAQQAVTGVEALQPLFKDAAEAGMTPREFESYTRLPTEAMDDATRTLEKRSLSNMKWLDNAISKNMKKLQAEAKKQRAQVRIEVTEEIINAPIYRAVRFLRTGEGVPEGVVSGLNRAALIEQYGDSPSAPWKFLPPRIVAPASAKATDGFGPDDVAKQFSMSSGDELIRLLVGIAPVNEAIDAAVDHEMLVRFGDLTNPEQQRRAAQEAVHNEARARFVAAELKALTTLQGAPGVGRRTLSSAAKAAAQRLVNAKRITDLRPHQYSQTANRLAREARKALSKGDTVKAASLKRQQLVATHAAREASKALENAEKGRRILRKFNNEGTRKGLDIEYLDQIDEMLGRFDLSTRSRPAVERLQSLAKWIEGQEAQGLEPEIDTKLRDTALRQNHSTLTVEEFAGLVDAIKNIAHLGRLKKKLITSKDKREFDERVAEAVETIEQNSSGLKPQQRSGDPKWAASIRQIAKGFVTEHRKFASFMREFDGFQDGGKLWELFVRPMNDAGNKEAGMLDKAQKDMAKLFAQLRDGPGLTDKEFIIPVGQSFTLEQRLGIALNTGNATNLERIMSGENWTLAQVQAVLDTLTKEQMDFVQSVWDYLETFRPAMAEKERRVTGAEPKWVVAQVVETKHGVFRGGYYPIVSDPVRSSKVEADAANEVLRQTQRGLYVRNTTRRGHLKQRAESTGRTLRYDMTNTIPQHAAQVIADLSWHEFLIDANRLLRDKRIDGAIRDNYGPEVLSELREHLTDIAIGHLPSQKGFGQAVNYLRKGVTTAFLGWRLTTSLLQPLGLTQSYTRLGGRHFFIGLSRTLLRGPHRSESAAKFIQGKSEFMRNRAATMQREMEEILNQLEKKRKTGKFASALDFVRETSFWPIQKMQQVADFPTWMGAYHKAWTQDGMTEDTAIALADQTVIDTQGGGQIKDLARIQRGNEFKKLWTNFYSFFSTTYNLLVEQGKAKKIGNIGMARLAGDYFALLIAPPAISMVVFDAILKGEDFEDEADFFWQLMQEILGYGMGTMVGLRDLGGALRGFGFKGPVGTRAFAELADLFAQIKQGDLDVTLLKKALQSAGILLHLPTGQVATTIDGIVALKEGETESPGALIAGGPPPR